MLVHLDKIQESISVSFADFVRNQEKNSNFRIIKMQTGDPDFNTHPKIISAALEAMKSGDTKYCDSRGLLALRQAISEKLRYKNNIHANPESEILITNGAVHAVSISIRALINEGDECIICRPYWRSYEMNVLLSGGIPIFSNADSDKDNFQINIDDINSKITKKTKLIIINSPNNPSGSVYNKEDLCKLAKIAKEKSIFILSDEVYEEFIYEGNTHYSIASDQNVFSNVISIFSFSKTYAMTGWRIGYLVANQKIVNQLLKLSQFSITCVSPFIQKAATEALINPDVNNYVDFMKSEYANRLNLIINLSKGTWLENSIIKPNGAFYALINMSAFKSNSTELAMDIVKKHSVSLTPGIAFGNDMDKYLRLCFASSEIDLHKAINELIKYGENIL